MKKLILSASAVALALAGSACARKAEKAEAAEAATAEAASGAADAVVAGAAEPAAAVAAAPAVNAALAAENENKSDAFLAENAKKEGVVTTASGLQYVVLNKGAAGSASPKASDIVDVHYVGTLTDGVKFDSSLDRGAAARFPLNEVIAGWTEGVQLMSVGDKFRFFVPPELGYGAEGTPGGPIGPNETLIFDVELIKVSNPEINLAAAMKFLAENGKKAGVKTTASGLQYQVLAEGPSGGKSPSDANVVRVHYEGRLLDGQKFDSSHDRGEPIEFPLARVIPGWTEGVQLMSEGDKFRFFIPPALAYGEGGAPGSPIGPNEALIFEVELIKVVG
jgi:peptidylprolyl isomerase